MGKERQEVWWIAREMLWIGNAYGWHGRLKRAKENELSMGRVSISIN
jgi:hypothetical protein